MVVRWIVLYFGTGVFWAVQNVRFIVRAYRGVRITILEKTGQHYGLMDLGWRRLTVMIGITVLGVFLWPFFVYAKYVHWPAAAFDACGERLLAFLDAGDKEGD
jgi:hypothetical protein